MSVVALRSNQDHALVPAPHPRAIEVKGAAKISFVHKDGASRLSDLYYRDPLKVLFPRNYQDDIPCATLLTTGGGLFGGDHYDVDISLATNAEALVTAQAAEKVYRSSGPDCTLNINLNVADNAVLEWLPQDTIIFNNARFRRTTRISMAPSAKVLAGEIIVLGRLASGEDITDGLIRDAWDIYQDGSLIWSDALHLEDDIQQCLTHPAGFGGARALASLVFKSPTAESHLEEARHLLGDFPQVKSGASLVNGVLVCRWLSPDPLCLRKAYGTFWAQFRNLALGRAATLPRLWHC